MNESTSQAAYFDSLAPHWDRWKSKNRYYHRVQENLFRFLVEPGSSVLEIGCATGDLLASVKPSRGVGVDMSRGMVEHARRKHPELTFDQQDAESLRFREPFAFVLMADLIGHLRDIEKALVAARSVMTPRSRLVVTYYNFLWEPVVLLAEKLRLKIPQPRQNWINTNDLLNLLELADFEVIRTGQRLLIPKNIPVVSWLLNKYVAQLPFFRRLCVTRYLVARPRSVNRKPRYSVSVVVPARNERGNIEKAVLQTPKMGSKTEIIFVEGHSRDGTLDEVKRVVKKYGAKRSLRYAVQPGAGKGDAVREGFRLAKGDILMILDGDLTVVPEDLPKFYDAIASNRGEFINGSRLVYPMEEEAMRVLNLFGNKFFSLMFTWLLGQRFKDTLCGTKVIFRKDYERIAKNRHYFGDFDPFGDFDLIFGAAKLNLKILEVPIRYRERTYGTTNISRFRHGLLLLQMCFFAMNKLKFRL
ncbi:MAG TPA: glycosyltransferase [Bacteroidota bacterium]|nr:glycosyltransferase [Bacteroidota bacterium]